VIGLGINVRMPVASVSAIDQPWTDLASLASTGGSPVSRAALAVACLDRLLPALAQFDHEGLAPFLPRYRALDALAGRQVVVRNAGADRPGVAIGIADDGALRLRDAEGEHSFHAGEVSVRAA